MKSLDECIKPVFDALADVRKIGDERRARQLFVDSVSGLRMFPDRQIVFDSGWYEWRRGEYLPPISNFRVNR